MPPNLPRLLCNVAMVAFAGAMLSAPCRSESASTGAPPGASRLSQDQYRNIIADTFGGDIKVAGRFEPGIRRDGMLAIGDGLASVTPSSMEQYAALAYNIAAQVTDPQHRDRLETCKPVLPSVADQACSRAFVATYGRRLFRRPPTPAELSAFTRVAVTTAGSLGDFYGGLEYALAAMLQSPEFLFIKESTVPGAAGGRQLDGFSRATRLSFFLWNSAPDAELLDAAQRGDLADTRKLAQQVTRMLASPKLETGVRNFFSDMLGLDRFDVLSKDPLIYPGFSVAVAADAKEQTLRTIVDQLVRRNADYRDLFTSRDTFVTRALGTVYRVPVATEQGFERYRLPEDRPATGILTQVSLLALNSPASRSSPTIRGRAIRESLLCQVVPDPPANVDFSLFENANTSQLKTARDRLALHNTNPTCAGCHRIMDPLGLALENFDGVGQFRRDENGTPIDSSGKLGSTDFKDVQQFAQALHDAPAIPSCLVQRTFEFALRRKARPGESEFVRYLNDGFSQDGYRLPALLRRLATSADFYRVTPAEG